MKDNNIEYTNNTQQFYIYDKKILLDFNGILGIIILTIKKYN